MADTLLLSLPPIRRSYLAPLLEAGEAEQAKAAAAAARAPVATTAAKPETWVASAAAATQQVSQARGLFAPPADVAAAIASGKAPPNDHPYMQYVNGIRAGLQKQRLPTSAEGVRVVVMGEANLVNTPIVAHAAGVAQTVSGAIGLAKGANVEMGVEASRYGSVTERYGPQLSLTKAGAMGKEMILHEIESRRRQIAEVVSRQQPGAPTTLVNMSNGMPVSGAMGAILVAMSKAPRGSTTYVELTKFLGHAPADTADGVEIARAIADSIRKELGSPDVVSARKALEADVAAARQKGVMVFKSAGNDQATADQIGRRDDAKAVDAVKGMVTVGAIDLGTNATDSSDDTVAPFSVRGATLGAVGVNVPLMGKNTKGTSFATPFIVSVAALMIKANPRITPDQIEQILKETAIPVSAGKFGGLNEVDVVKAVARAAGKA